MICSLNNLINIWCIARSDASSPCRSSHVRSLSRPRIGFASRLFLCKCFFPPNNDFFSCQDETDFEIDVRGWFCEARHLFDLVTGVARAIGHRLQSFFGISWNLSIHSDEVDCLADLSNICRDVHLMMADYSMLPGYSTREYNSLFGLKSSVELGPEEFD